MEIERKEMKHSEGVRQSKAEGEDMDETSLSWQ